MFFSWPHWLPSCWLPKTSKTSSEPRHLKPNMDPKDILNKFWSIWCEGLAWKQLADWSPTRLQSKRYWQILSFPKKHRPWQKTFPDDKSTRRTSRPDGKPPKLTNHSGRKAWGMHCCSIKKLNFHHLVAYILVIFPLPPCMKQVCSQINCEPCRECCDEPWVLFLMGGAELKWENDMGNKWFWVSPKMV